MCCFGSRKALLSQRTVVRNLIILVLIAAAAITTSSAIQVTPSLSQVLMALSATSVAASVAAFRFAKPFLLTRGEVRKLIK
jgi:hypothetical protein